MLRRSSLIAAVVASLVTAIAAQSRPPMTEILDSYYQGRYDEAVTRAAAIADLGPVRLWFVQDAPVWAQADAGAVETRRAAAAAFLLDLTHARLETDWGRFIDLIEFTCVNLRAGQPAPAFELAWHRASVALASRARARLWLLGEFAQLPHQPPRTITLPKNQNQNQNQIPSPRHLMHALDRFPDDPQLRLARVVAWLWGRDQEPIRNVRMRSESPTRMIRVAPQREALKSLEPLAGDAVVGAEAHARIGLVHVSTGDAVSALPAFEAAERAATGPAIRYLALFSAGRALEALGRPDEAIARYTAALGVIPDAESAAVALASLQFVRDDREHAVALTRRVFAEPRATVDPGRLAGYGSFMHWPELQAAMRRELGR